MIAVSAEAWQAILYLITPWQYPPRLGVLFNILSRLGSIRRGYILLRPGGILLLSAEGRGCILLRHGSILQGYILSRLSSIRQGWASYSYLLRALAGSAEAWHSIQYLFTPWQYPPTLGILFNILSRLGSIRRGYIVLRLGSILRGLACYSIS